MPKTYPVAFREQAVSLLRRRVSFFAAEPVGRPGQRDIGHG